MYSRLVDLPAVWSASRSEARQARIHRRSCNCLSAVTIGTGITIRAFPAAIIAEHLLVHQSHFAGTLPLMIGLRIGKVRCGRSVHSSLLHGPIPSCRQFGRETLSTSIRYIVTRGTGRSCSIRSLSSSHVWHSCWSRPTRLPIALRK